jgi:hypothetical protein
VANANTQSVSTSISLKKAWVAPTALIQTLPSKSKQRQASSPQISPSFTYKKIPHTSPSRSPSLISRPTGVSESKPP